MFCPSCGTKNMPDAAACAVCGKALPRASSPSRAPPSSSNGAQQAPAEAPKILRPRQPAPLKPAPTDDVPPARPRTERATDGVPPPRMDRVAEAGPRGARAPSSSAATPPRAPTPVRRAPADAPTAPSARVPPPQRPGTSPRDLLDDDDDDDERTVPAEPVRAARPRPVPVEPAPRAVATSSRAEPTAVPMPAPPAARAPSPERAEPAPPRKPAPAPAPVAAQPERAPVPFRVDDANDKTEPIKPFVDDKPTALDLPAGRPVPQKPIVLARPMAIDKTEPVDRRRGPGGGLVVQPAVKAGVPPVLAPKPAAPAEFEDAGGDTLALRLVLRVTPLWRTATAGIIDFVGQGAVGAAAAAAVWLARPADAPRPTGLGLERVVEALLLAPRAALAFALVFVAASVLHQAALVAFAGGTVGQLLLGLRVVHRKTGARPGIVRAAIRGAASSLGTLAFAISPLYAFWVDSLYRGFGDIFARTVVARRAQPGEVGDVR